jgi:hypothetical protein
VIGSSWYCTLAEARREIDPQQDKADAYVLSVIPQVSHEIENALAMEFEPVRETRRLAVNALALSVDGTKLRIRRYEDNRRMWLIALKNIWINDALMSPDDIDVLFQPTYKPVDTLNLVPGNGTCQRLASTCRNRRGWDDVVEVDAVWCWRNRPATDGWLKAGDLSISVDNPIGPATTYIESVGHVNDVGVNGLRPTFSAGNLVRMGAADTDEVVRVVATDYMNSLSFGMNIVRAQKGTTAIAYPLTVPLYIWNMQPEIKDAAVRWATYEVMSQGVFESITVTDAGTFNLRPGGMPRDVRATLAAFVDSQV